MGFKVVPGGTEAAQGANLLPFSRALQLRKIPECPAPDAVCLFFPLRNMKNKDE